MPRTHLQMKLMPIEALIPAPYNPRDELPPESPAYRKLATSLRAFGLVEPLLWNEATGHLVGGHTRLRILKELGVSEVPVSVVRLSVAREKALNVVLNNREAQGRFDPARLAELLTELRDLPELKLTGFEPSAIANLRLAPIADLPPIQEPAATVEITLTMPAGTFEQCSHRLDALIGEFDLISHVRKR